MSGRLGRRGIVANLLCAVAVLGGGAALVTAGAPAVFAVEGQPGPAPAIAPVLIARGDRIAGRPISFSYVSAGVLTSPTWAFGDGTTSALERPTHAYAGKGTYTVTLTAADAEGPPATITVSVLAAWSGGVQLYQGGVFSMQATMRWCVAASSQMIRNIATGGRDHSAASQQRYFIYGRAHNGYRTPESDGIDPAGWQAILRTYVDPGYHIVATTSYADTLRAAARAIRLTGRPVGVFVGFGAHVWVMSGFTATADPATSTSFQVTSVNVEGPLWGRQSRGGFDQAPNVRLSFDRFRSFLTPYRDPFEPLGWRNRYVVIAP